MQDVLEDFRGIAAEERPPARQHLEERGAQAEEIGARRGRHAGDLLRREVWHGAANFRMSIADRRHPEIAHLDESVVRNQNIRRLDIAMDDPPIVCGAEPTRDLPQHEKCKLNRQRTGIEQFRQIYALDILGYEVRRKVVLTVRKDGQDRKSTRLNSSHVAISYAV